MAAIRDEVLDWHHRWVPPAWHGRTLADVAATRPHLFEADGPMAVLDRAALEHNLTAMADWCAHTGVSLAPHAKTTMAPQLVTAQIAHGAWGVTVASLAQARVLRAFGMSPIVIANEVVDRAGLAWMVAEQRRDPTFRMLCWVDSLAGVALLDDAVAGGRLDVLVEIGHPGWRTGCRTLQSVVDVAAAVQASRRLRLTGISGYEGIAATVEDADGLLASMASAARRLSGMGFFDDVDEVILSAGGSVYFDRVAAVLVGALDRPTRVVVRSGSYVTHDSGFYAGMTPSARGAPGVPRFQAAVRVWARVISRPEPGLLLLAAGRRDVPYDQGLPVPVDRSGWRLTELNDQHAYLAIPADDDAGVGDWVALGISHPCTLFDRWTLLPVVSGDTVVDLVRTFF